MNSDHDVSPSQSPTMRRSIPHGASAAASTEHLARVSCAPARTYGGTRLVPLLSMDLRGLGLWLRMRLIKDGGEALWRRARFLVARQGPAKEVLPVAGSRR